MNGIHQPTRAPHSCRSPILDIAIGIGFVFLCFSLVVTLLCGLMLDQMIHHQLG